VEPGLEDPFLYDQVTLPSRRMRMPLRVPLHAGQRRILVLVAIALVLAVIGAVVGTVLLTRPRKVRSTVRADLRALDERLVDTVRCLGGTKAQANGSDLPRRLWQRSLRRADWPALITRCRRRATLLLSTASAVNASADAAPSRVPEAIRSQYERAVTAATEIHQSVVSLAEEARAGHRLPDWTHCRQVASAVARFQILLGEVERLAELSRPRRAPTDLTLSPPPWPGAAPLATELNAGPTTRLRPLRPGPFPRALRLWLRLPANPRQILLLRPSGRARWVALPSRLPRRQAKGHGAGASNRTDAADPTRLFWLAVIANPPGNSVTPPGTAKQMRAEDDDEVSLLWARSRWQSSTRRGLLEVGQVTLPEIWVSGPISGQRPGPKSGQIPRQEPRRKLRPAATRRAAARRAPTRRAPRRRDPARRAAPRRAATRRAAARRAATRRAADRRAAARHEATRRAATRRAATRVSRPAGGTQPGPAAPAPGRLGRVHRLRWPLRPAVAPQVHAGWTEGSTWHLLASAPRGTARELIHRRFLPVDAKRRVAGGRPGLRPTVLATDLGLHAAVIAWEIPRGEGAGPLLTYPVRGGGIAVQRLPAGKKPQPPGSRPRPAGNRPLPAGKATPLPDRALLDPGSFTSVEAACTTRGHTYVLLGSGRLWAAAPGGGFRLLPWPGAAGRTQRLACAEGQAALAWQDPHGPLFFYTTCAPGGCRSPRRVSWSRLRAVELIPTAGSVLLLAAEQRLLFSRRDLGVTGGLEPPRPVTRWERPPRCWRAVRGPTPTHLAVLLLDGALSRLRSTDGGHTWEGG
jgi:hypothetical protein